MDRNMKVQNVNGSVDMVSSLPDELLIRILSLLPTKDVASMCVLSRRMRRAFPWITSLDFDDSPISHCLEHPYVIERFPAFKKFVDTVLHAHQSPYLSRFRLRVGADFTARYFHGDKAHFWKVDRCFPELKSTQINAWISFPLTRCGLRELDLRIQVSEPGNCQLPPEIFTFETLEVLKLDVNLGIKQVSKVSSIRLPNLKLLHFRASLSNSGHLFVKRLVSSCPLLEELTLEVVWNNVRSTTISSPSLRRLCLRVRRSHYHKLINPIFVAIHTPNLEYFDYCDGLAANYSFSSMHSLVKADIDILYNLRELGTLDSSFRQMRNLIRPFSKVQHLSLLGTCTEDLEFVKEEDKLSLFPNLTHLELGCAAYTAWDKLLLSLLNGSPVLKTLIFPKGLTEHLYTKDFPDGEESVELERKFFRTTQEVIPTCCRFHLKKIVIKKYFGNEWEIDMIQFLLTHALVLKELVVYRCLDTYNWRKIVDKMSLEATIKKLPRVPVTCSIQVH